MTKEEKIENFIEKHNLVRIETTTGTNGYPENIKKAIIGFDNEDVLNEFINLLPDNNDYTEMKSFKQRDGWRFFMEEGYVTESYTYDDYLNTAGDNYNEVDIFDEISFVINSLKDLSDDEQDAENFIDSVNEYASTLGTLIQLSKDIDEENEVCINEYGEYTTCNKEFMNFSHDVWRYAIGVYI